MPRDEASSMVGLLLTPLLVVAFACGTIGSFLIWRVRILRATGAEHVPFHLHRYGDDESSAGEVTVACVLGLVALMLPLSLILQAAAA